MVEEIWAKIEKWLYDHSNEILNDLNTLGKPRELENFEKHLDVTLPVDFKESFFKHDGQKMDSSALFGDWYLLPVAEIENRWEILKELWDEGDFEDTSVKPDPQVKSQWWEPKWIPITHNGAGDLHCLDLDPSPQGKYGQVILFEHMNETRKCVAPSFKDFLQKFVDDIESGKYIINERGGIEKK